MAELSRALMSDIDIAGQRQLSMFGHVSRFDGQMIECGGFPANIGSLCHVETDDDTPAVAELIGFQNGNNLLSLHQFGARIRVGARVTLADDGATIPVGDALLGRITDALGNPIDGQGPLRPDDSWPLMGREINPLARKPVNAPLDVGVRAINALLSVGKGQRIGIIAGSGVGKSVLLGMMSRFTTADIVVVGMIGERGREVGEFAKTVLDQNSKSVPPLSRFRRTVRHCCGSAGRSGRPQSPNITGTRARMSFSSWTADPCCACAARDRPRPWRTADGQGLSAFVVR